MRPSQNLATLLAFCLCGALALLVAWVSALSIERRSVAAVQGRMDDAGLSWVSIAGDGLLVTIGGEAPDEAARFRALTSAGAVIDEDRLIDAITVRDPAGIAAPEFVLEMLRNSDGISLIGLIPAATDGASVASRIADITNGVEVANLVESLAYPVPESWNRSLEFGLNALRLLPRSKVSVYDGRVVITAVADSAAERARVMAALQNALSDDIEAQIDISAPRPVITPFAMRFVIDAAGARFETCAADTEASAARILAAAQEAGADAGQCPIGLGVPSTEWGNAVAAAIAALTEIGQGAVSFSDADVTLVAAEGTSQRLFDRVVGELNRALPAVFSLNAILTPSTEGTTEAQSAEFTANFGQSGQVQLRGRLPDARYEEATQAFAQALFGLDRVYMATRVASDLPEGWPLRVLAGLEALSLLADGELRVTETELFLSGRSAQADVVDRVSRLLGEKLDGNDTFTLDVRFDEGLLPAIPETRSADACMADLRAILDENKIRFDPGSVEVNDEAGAILDLLAPILRDCTHVPIEISGHTDSQGREEMNLTLSQTRADAVLNGLLARQVLVSNLTAVGYGETRPLASNDTEEGREANRRIEFRLRDAQEDSAQSQDTPDPAPAGETQ